jgi:hypothetical protein
MDNGQLWMRLLRDGIVFVARPTFLSPKSETGLAFSLEGFETGFTKALNAIY